MHLSKVLKNGGFSNPIQSIGTAWPRVGPSSQTDRPIPGELVNYWLTKITIGFTSHKPNLLPCKPTVSTHLIICSLFKDTCVFIPRLESICLWCGTSILVILKENFVSDVWWDLWLLKCEKNHFATHPLWYKIGKDLNYIHDCFKFLSYATCKQI